MQKGSKSKSSALGGNRNRGKTSANRVNRYIAYKPERGHKRIATKYKLLGWNANDTRRVVETRTRIIGLRCIA